MDGIWKPEIGGEVFEDITYSRLSAVAAAHTQKKKTYNNVVSAMRCAFAFKDRPPVDPFTIQEAEIIIEGSHQEFGLAHGNYEEFRFFTGLRQSEQIALTIDDCDLKAGKISINKALVQRRAKDRTKTGADREIELCSRAFVF